jgi:hypothetical protein
VIGHGYGGHPKFLHALAQLFDITSAIEQGIVGVQVQVNELGHWDLWVSLTHTRPRKGVEGCGIQTSVISVPCRNAPLQRKLYTNSQNT